MYLTEWNDVSLLSEKDWLAMREKLKDNNAGKTGSENDCADPR